jgi:hypothetical protein
LLVVTTERSGITIEDEGHTMEFVLLLIGQLLAAIVYMSIQKSEHKLPAEHNIERRNG